MLPAPHRLPTRQIAFVVRKGKKKLSENLVVWEFKTPNLPVPRLAIVISKQVSKLAVVRNRCRRKVRAELIQLLKAEKIPAQDMVIKIMRPGVAEMDSASLAAELASLLI